MPPLTAAQQPGTGSLHAPPQQPQLPHAPPTPVPTALGTRPGTVRAQAAGRREQLSRTAGGVTPRGSVRRVEVKTGGPTGRVDLLRFELVGADSQSPYVVDNMRVRGPPRGATLTVSGAARR